MIRADVRDRFAKSNETPFGAGAHGGSRAVSIWYRAMFECSSSVAHGFAIVQQALLK
jgi:hypothetical protein